MVECAPAVLPPRFDLSRARARKRREHAQGRVAVRRELDPVALLVLLEPFRCEVEEARAQLLELAARRADRGADQRKALRSFRMKPSSVSP
jgi:hypothetical protein